MNNIDFLLKDNRLCKSNNMQKFFRKKSNRHHFEVIRFLGELWFVSLGWRTSSGNDDGFAGVRVVEVACQGASARTHYPSWQKGGDYEIVTDWFWGKYKERGIVSLPEIWHRKIPRPLTSKEAHCI